VASALIAVAALVAAAGPAQTLAPGSIEPLDPRAFTRVAPPALDDATTAPALEQAAPADTLGDTDRAIADPGTPPLPSGRAAAQQPNPPARVVVKATPRPRPAVASTTSGGSWNRAEYSWYGPGLYGNGTACGQKFTSTILGVAHKSLPCGTRVTFRNPENGRSITVPVIDRGPYTAGRMWDLSYATCSALGNCHTGTIQYRLP
jgi:hypothetical protein